MKSYYRSIIFTKTPLHTQFRYRDVFQVFPAYHLKSVPSSEMQRHYPVILEYWISDDEEVYVADVFEEIKDMITTTTRMLVKQDLILSLLSCFTNHLFFRYTDTTGSWGFPILKENAGEEMNTWSSKWNMTLFHSPELPNELKITEFSGQLYPDIKLVKHFPYYMDDPNLDRDSKKEITFPTTIHMDLDSYFEQSKADRQVLDTAISYAVSAIELKNTKKTMSVVAAFTSIETMVNLEFKDMPVENCKTCGQPQFKVAYKYRKYLLKYIGDSPENKKKFNAYYALRSKIVHTGERFKTENLFADVSEADKTHEYVSQINIMILSKLAIVQWLLKNRKHETVAAE